MKSFFRLIFTIILMYPVLNQAQTTIGFKLGLLATPLINYNEDATNTLTVNYKPSYSAAFIITEQISEIFSFGVDICYAHYSATTEGTYSRNSRVYLMSNTSYKFGYLGVYLRPQLTFGKKLKYYFNAGPYFAILLNSHFDKIEYYRASGEEEFKQYQSSGKATEDLRPFPLFLLMGSVGLQYDIGNSWNLLVDFSTRYGPSLINDSYISGQMDILLSAGFTYKLKPRSKFD